LPRTPPQSSASLVLFGLAALLWIQLHALPETNFGGFDEWMVLDLNAHGIVSVPYANRPLGLSYSLPASLLWAHGFGLRSFTGLYALYMLASAALLVALCRRLAAGEAAFALQVPLLFLFWAPGDLCRLSTIERVLYAGITLGVLACFVLFVESWARRSPGLLALACGAALLSARGYEGGLALLAGAPLLLLGQPRSRRLGAWIAAWGATLALAGASALRFLLAASREQAYQLEVLKPQVRPLQWLSRMAYQYAYHLAPLVLSAPSELARGEVAATVAVLLVILALHARSSALAVGPTRAWLLGAAGIGLLLAGLGYSLIVLGTAAPTAFRLEFLSAPGIALFLAATTGVVSSFAPGSVARLARGALCVWIVAVGTGRTLAMQATWDRGSAHAGQTRALAALLAVVPDVEPHTLVVFLDQGRAWRASYGFHHAVRTLYHDRAAGFVPGVWDALYPVRFAADGAHLEPWPVLRGPWRCEAERFGYAEIIVVRQAPDGAVQLLETWPDALGPLPAGALYAPRARVRGAGR
jgi:hypothetical protein